MDGAGHLARICKQGITLPILLTRLLTTMLDGLGCQRNQSAADQGVKTCPDS